MKHVWLVAAIAAGSIFGSASSASATEVQLVGMGGMDSVLVWQSRDAHTEGNRLISANVHRSNPALLMPLIACMVPSGTRAIITSVGFATHDIMVIAGPHSGCRGNIPAEAARR